MTEKAYWKAFRTQLPSILGSLFNVIKQVLSDANNDYQADCRMADFAQLGYKIANALGTGLGERFITIYNNNQKRAQEESKPPMALECISYLMEYKRDWTGTMSQLLHVLRPIAIRLDYKNEFPCSANALSRQINKCKDRFAEYGLTWSQKTNGDRQIRIINKAPKAY